jgi:hypothetical protein
MEYKLKRHSFIKRRKSIREQYTEWCERTGETLEERLLIRSERKRLRRLLHTENMRNEGIRSLLRFVR